MPTLTVTESYATVSEADAYLENNTSWAAATDETKTDALLFARYYIDYNFSCTDITDELTVPDAMKYATSLLAADYVADNTVFDSGANLRRELIQAGSVISEKEYFGGATNKPGSLALVKGVLKDLCSYSKSTPFLLRG